MLELTTNIIDWLQYTANGLKGSVRRMFMAKTMQQLGYGGASAAENRLGWNRAEV